MDGIPAFDLWNLVIEVVHSSPNHSNKNKDVRELRGNLSANPQPNMRKQIPTTHTNFDLNNIDLQQAEHILVSMLWFLSLWTMKP